MQNDVDDKTSLGGTPKDGAYSGDDAIAAAAKAAAEQKIHSIDEQLGNVPKKVAEKIKSCENILVALSQDPSVDEISAAIGLTMILNKLGKHVTAIYSGETPNTLEFLKPEETFEKDTNSLQDFIIALNKDKADHLRYKIEGDYVKVYITPYKTTISQTDLEFSQGDFNVDLVISIDVDTAELLDGALEEYGRIMHDATAINITTNQAGHFAELEWSDPSMSSVCEMIVNLTEYLDYKEFEQPVATALLTGIVSATERFSNARTTSETMQISSRLMQAGADQQLISSNIMTKEEKKEEPVPAPVEETPAPAPAPEPVPEAPLEPLIPAPTLTTPQPAPTAPAPAPAAEPTPEQQLEQMVAAPAAATGMPENLANELATATPETPAEPETPVAPVAPAEPEVLVGTPAPVAPKPAPSLEPAGPEGLTAPTTLETEPIQNDTMALPGQVSQDDVQAAMNEILNPAQTTPATTESGLPEIVSQGSVMTQNVAEPLPESPDYGAMIDQALSDASAAPANPAAQAAPVVPTALPDAASLPNMQFDPNATPAAMMNPTPAPTATAAPAVAPEPTAPAAPVAPEAPAQPVEVPQNIDIELPPPPAPNIDMSNAGMPPVVATAPEPVAPAPAPAPVAPAAAPTADPSAFQIPKA
jgi:hypothetical protein